MNEFYKENKKEYYFHLLEQYKLYVEMADRVSQRRNSANVFFTGINTTVLSIIGLNFKDRILEVSGCSVVLIYISLLILCVVWWWLIRSYRNLNTAKYKVIGEMEKQLPVSPYYNMEWKMLGEGRSIKKYLPLTVIEQYLPIVFWVIYTVIMSIMLAYQ